MMAKDDDSDSLDRRIFLGATTATLLGLPGISLAQQQKPSRAGSAPRSEWGLALPASSPKHGRGYRLLRLIELPHRR